MVLPAWRGNIGSVFSEGFVGVLSKRPGGQLGLPPLGSCCAGAGCLRPGNFSNPLLKNPAFECPAQIPSLGLSILQGRTSAGAAGRRRRVSALAEAEGGCGFQAQHRYGRAANYLPAPAGANGLTSFFLPSQGPVTLSPSFSLRRRVPRLLIALLFAYRFSYLPSG